MDETALHDTEVYQLTQQIEKLQAALREVIAYNGSDNHPTSRIALAALQLSEESKRWRMKL